MRRFSQCTGWEAAAWHLHTRVLEACLDSLAQEVARLHQPVVLGADLDGLVCEGCDQATRTDPPASWPCRTYTIVATTALRLDRGGLEDYLTALRHHPQPPQTAGVLAGTGSQVLR
jgi:hypothetical protein